jgi:HSP20 family protein
MTHREKVHEQIEALLEEGWPLARFSSLRHGFRPNLDSYHTAGPHELTVIVELPGVDPRSLTMTVSERTLVIAGERRRTKAEGRVYQQMEIEYGPFERRVRLAEDVDPGRARARFVHGLLTIVLPVAETSFAAQRQTISVERA